MKREKGQDVTDQAIVLVNRARAALDSVANVKLNTQGVFPHPQSQVAALKAARDHVDKAIAVMERKWQR